ncbi:MAG: SpoIIE family protein phosphatase [Candidatus Contendobacter sp.]|nr:SpoIIE family protein phosphatase [Candidatus Contendobacter sp.]
MKLRTRITLSVSLCFGVVVGGLALEGQLQEWSAARRYRETLLTGYRNTWSGVAGSELQRLAAAIPLLTRNDDAVRALARRDPDGYANSLKDLLPVLRDGSIPATFEVATLDGRLFFSTVLHELAVDYPALHPDRNPAAPQILSIGLIDAVLRAGQPLTGLLMQTNGCYGLTVAFPLLDRSGPVAVGALYFSANQLLPAFAASVGAPAFLLHINGSPVADADPGPWRPLDPSHKLIDHTGLRTDVQGKQVLTLAWLALPDLFNREVAILLTVEDITIQYWREVVISFLYQGGILVALALFLGGLYWYLRRAFRPLNQVVDVLNALTRGETGLPTIVIGSTRDDEIGRLANTADQFRQAQAARTQLLVIRKELNIATRIQRSLQPINFPDRKELAVFAELHPFSEVGGDFYDFFDLPDGRLGLVIADVSDKGIAAALFMAFARTVIHTIAQIIPEPGDCLERANHLLSHDNAASMFVTTFYGVLNPASGELCYVNAGHNPPYHIMVDGKVAALARTGGMALGVMDDLAFVERKLALAPGERLLFYTDGVTEAINEASEEFSTHRLENTLAVAPASPREMIAAVVAAVQTFAGAAPPTDDLTLLALLYRGTGEAVND